MVITTNTKFLTTISRQNYYMCISVQNLKWPTFLCVLEPKNRAGLGWHWLISDNARSRHLRTRPRPLTLSLPLTEQTQQMWYSAKDSFWFFFNYGGGKPVAWNTCKYEYELPTFWYGESLVWSNYERTSTYYPSPPPHSHRMGPMIRVGAASSLHGAHVTRDSIRTKVLMILVVFTAIQHSTGHIVRNIHLKCINNNSPAKHSLVWM